MQIVLMFIIGIASALCAGIFYKTGSAAVAGKRWGPPLFCLVYMFLAAVAYGIVLLVTTPQPHFSLLTVLFTMLSGCSLSLAAVFYILSMQSGAFTICAAVINFSCFVPVLYAAVILKETITAKQLVGVIGLLTVVLILVLSNRGKSEKKVKLTGSFTAMITLTFITNTVNPFVQRCQAVFVGGEANETMFLHFVFATLTSLILFTVFGGWKNVRFADVKGVAVPSVGLAACVGLNLLTLTRLPRLGVPSAVQYPIVYASTVILSSFLGAALYKDKLKITSYIALAAGIGFIILLTT